MKTAAGVLAYLLLAIPVWGGAPLPKLMDGDLIFQTSRSNQSIAIQRATDSKYSHVGMIFIHKGKPFVFEAVQTVRFTPLNDWTSRGDNGHFVIKRINNADAILTDNALRKLRRQAMVYKNKPYDLTFEWSDKRIYCSELVWKAYYKSLGIKIGKTEKLKDFNITDPIVARKIKERYGSKVPYNETVISPKAMFEANNLITIYGN